MKFDRMRRGGPAASEVGGDEASQFRRPGRIGVEHRRR
jgi:hypothetical protein